MCVLRRGDGEVMNIRFRIFAFALTSLLLLVSAWILPVYAQCRGSCAVCPEPYNGLCGGTVRCGRKDCDLRKAKCTWKKSGVDIEQILMTPGSHSFTITPEDIVEWEESILLPLEVGGGEVYPVLQQTDFTITITEYVEDMVYFDVVSFAATLSSVMVQEQPTGPNIVNLDPSMKAYGNWNSTSKEVWMFIPEETTNDLLVENNMRMPGDIEFNGTIIYDTVTLTGTGGYVLVKAVGGIAIPIDKLVLLAPYFGSALAVVATVATVFCVKRIKRRKEA